MATIPNRELGNVSSGVQWERNIRIAIVAPEHRFSGQGRPLQDPTELDSMSNQSILQIDLQLSLLILLTYSRLLSHFHSEDEQKRGEHLKGATMNHSELLFSVPS